MNQQARRAKLPWAILTEFANRGNPEELNQYIESLGPSETFRALLRMPAVDRDHVLTGCGLHLIFFMIPD